MCSCPRNTRERGVARIDAGPSVQQLHRPNLSASLTTYREPQTSVVDPFLFEAGEAIALARHLDPAGEEARRREQQAVFEVGRVVAVLLEGRDRDLLVVRIVLEAAGAERNRFRIGAPVGAGFEIGVSNRGGAREAGGLGRVSDRG